MENKNQFNYTTEIKNGRMTLKVEGHALTASCEYPLIQMVEGRTKRLTKKQTTLYLVALATKILKGN